MNSPATLAHRLFVAAAVTALWAGCTGEVQRAPAGASDRPGGSDALLGGSARALFSCDPDAQPASAGWRRLTRRQYQNTLHSALSELLSGADLEDVWEAVQRPLDGLPEPTQYEGAYRRMDQDVAGAHVEAWYRVARTAADALTQPGRLEQVYGACASDADPTNDADCVDALLDSWAPHVLRRPLDSETREFYRGFYPELGSESLREGFADVLAGLLNAPQMLYMVEHGDDPEMGDSGVHPLSAYELASRLSYHFWESPPDEELRAAAASGALLEDDEYERQVQRLFDDPLTRETLREFYRDWLHLETLPALDANAADPRFKAFAGDDIPSDDLREQAIDEVLDMLDYYTWEEEGGVADILTTPESFARGDELAGLYGIEPWDGESDPPLFAEGERPGLLTRLAFLATGTPTTRPIMKGVFIRRQILCDVIPPPPANAPAAAPPTATEVTGTREVVEDLTEQPDTGCAGCHDTLINGLGFATEGFDALGRSRSTEQLFDANGKPAGEAEIDTRSAPKVVPGDPAQSQGPEDLVRLIVDSGKAHACLARSYFRFSFGRMEDVTLDGCSLERLRTSLSNADSLREMLRSVAMTDSFKQRTFAK